MTGDVLPCFDGSSVSLPENGAVVITVPASLARASKHGVILGSQVGTAFSYVMGLLASWLVMLGLQLFAAVLMLLTLL